MHPNIPCSHPPLEWPGGSWWAAADHEPAMPQQQRGPTTSWAVWTGEVIIPLYSTLISPLLQYWVHFGGLQYSKDIAKLERAQRSVTRMVEHLPCEQRLRELGLLSLERRQIWGTWQQPGSTYREVTEALHTGAWWEDKGMSWNKSVRLDIKKTFHHEAGQVVELVAQRGCAVSLSPWRFSRTNLQQPGLIYELACCKLEVGLETS